MTRAALPMAPLRPPAGDMLNVLFEVGRDTEGWTLMPAEQLDVSRSERLLQMPLDPPVTVDGHVVTSLATPEPCVASYVAAFADRTSASGERPGRLPGLRSVGWPCRVLSTSPPRAHASKTRRPVQAATARAVEDVALRL